MLGRKAKRLLVKYRKSVLGFSLLEVLVATAIFACLIAAMFAVLNIGSATYYSDFGWLDLQQQARQSMDGMTRELRQTKESELSEAVSGPVNEISFYIPSETYGGAWIGPIRYYFDSDNNRMMREYPVGTDKILANDITSVSFFLSGDDVLDIELTCSKTVRNRSISLVKKGRVRLRNE